MDTALYYFFSTASQTFAAAIALFGALVLFRMQSLNLELDQHAEFMISKFHKNEEDMQERTFCKKMKRYNSLNQHYKTIADERKKSWGDEFQRAHSTLELLLLNRSHLARSYIIVMLYSAILILYSLLSIMLVPIMSTKSCLWVTAYALATILILFNIVAYYRMIKMIFTDVDA